MIISSELKALLIKCLLLRSQELYLCNDDINVLYLSEEPYCPFTTSIHFKVIKCSELCYLLVSWATPPQETANVKTPGLIARKPRF